MKGITGKTALYGLIGEPVAHSFSPAIHNYLAERMDDDLRYLAFRVAPGDVAAAVGGARALGVRGLNVTMPHKEAAAQLACRLDETASRARAVNTLALTADGYVGYNTDIYGIYMTLVSNSVETRGKRAAVLGAGGAARAAAIALMDGGAAQVLICNRTKERAAALAGEFDLGVCSPEELTRADFCDIVINTTSAGFGAAADETPLPNADFSRIGAYIDAIYHPWETRAMREAAAAGAARVVNGFDMLVFQALRAYEIWRGAAFDEAFLKQAQNELTARYTALLEG